MPLGYLQGGDDKPPHAKQRHPRGRIDSCITQLKAQGPSRTCNESKEEEEKEDSLGSTMPHRDSLAHSRTAHCFFTLVTGPRRFLSLKLSDTRVHEPQIRARLGTTTHFCDSRTHSQTVPINNRCLSNWATVVCQKEELSTHWISLYLSCSHPFFFFFTLVTGPRSLSLKLSDTRVFEPQTRAHYRQ